MRIAFRHLGAPVDAEDEAAPCEDVKCRCNARIYRRLHESVAITILRISAFEHFESQSRRCFAGNRRILNTPRLAGDLSKSPVIRPRLSNSI
jgi:hypothetical protein